MLKKENRLKARMAFRATYKNNSAYYTPELVLHLGKFKIDKNCPTRVGFVVSKKVHKRAVRRNRIKRLLRENVRLFFKDEEISKIINNYQSLIFSAKTDISDKNIEDVRNIILTLLNNLANKNIQDF